MAFCLNKHFVSHEVEEMRRQAKIIERKREGSTLRERLTRKVGERIEGGDSGSSER